jgi:hypothetical protein
MRSKQVEISKMERDLTFINDLTCSKNFTFMSRLEAQIKSMPPDAKRAWYKSQMIQRRSNFILNNLDIIPEDKRAEKMWKALLATDEANAECARLNGNIKQYEMWMKRVQDIEHILKQLPIETAITAVAGSVT